MTDMITSKKFLARYAPGTDDPACDEGRDWLAAQPDAAMAWDTCRRGDWMLWAAQRVLTLTDRQWRALAIAFARHVLPLWRDRYPDQAETWLAWADDPDGADAEVRRGAAASAAARVTGVDGTAAGAAAGTAAWAAAGATNRAAGADWAADRATWANRADWAANSAASAAWADLAAEYLWQADEIRRQLGNPWR